MANSLEIWRHDLDARPIINDPHVPPASTLAGVVDRLTAVANVLATLDNGHAEERQFGLDVVGMAVIFASHVLEHLGRGTYDLLPSFLNIKMASLAINNGWRRIEGNRFGRQWKGTA
jgi:hypothetical protein